MSDSYLTVFENGSLAIAAICWVLAYRIRPVANVSFDLEEADVSGSPLYNLFRVAGVGFVTLFVTFAHIQALIANH